MLEGSYSLTSSAEQHELSTTELFNGENGDKRCQEVFSTVECGEKTTEETRKADAVLEDSSCVILSQC